jgi:phage gp46-like protein
VFETALIADNTSKTSAIVLSLVEPLLNRGYTLWMDNFYNASALAQKLKSLKTDCVGTLR